MRRRILVCGLFGGWLALSGCNGASADGADGCAGLACSPCDPADSAEYCSLPSVVCKGDGSCPPEVPIACSAGADEHCEPTETGSCTKGDRGTRVADFVNATCLGGVCIYQVVRDECSEGISCKKCIQEGEALKCHYAASQPECAACCVNQALSITRNQKGTFACACESGPCAEECGESPLCDGIKPQSKACSVCLVAAFRPGGACIDDAAFQSGCVQHDENCAEMAQCVATCHG